MASNQWDIIRAKYVASAVRPDQYPLPAMKEVAFIGRSNVGKSSLINSLTRRNSLARVSGSPGKTQTINFYELEAKRMLEEGEQRSNFFLVDLPGYGFARASKDNKSQWSVFIRNYMSGSKNLKLVCQLIDIRHKPLENDLECYHWLLECGLPVQLVLTKSDKVSKNAAASQKALFKRELGLDDDRIMTYTAVQHTNRNELIARIMDYIEQRPGTGAEEGKV